MRKTLALFAIAVSLLVTALVIGLQQPTTTPDPVDPVPTPVAPKPIVTKGASKASIGNVVKLHASLSNSFVRADRPGSLSLLMDLNAINAGTTQRPNMGIALVVDRSGSMAGEKILQARRAAKELVTRLNNDDQISIITYSSDYSVDLPLTRIKGQRGRINRVIDEILDGGGTNLAGGLQAGIKSLRGSTAAARRVILLSDGNANQGITDPGAIARISREARQQGITVSSLGLGVDFNEDLMTLVAQSAGGGYYYARNASAIATAFEQELSGLVKLAARNVEVGLELAQGVTISEVYGYRTEMRRGRLVVPVGDMTGGERRRIMVKLNMESAPTGQRAITNVVLSYGSTTNGQEREHRASLSVGATDSDSQLARSERPAVVEAFEAAEAARIRQEAAFSFQSGNKGQAIQKLKRQIKRTRQRNTQLKSPFLDNQVVEMETALKNIGAFSVDSDAGKDLVKSEKLRARQVFAY